MCVFVRACVRECKVFVGVLNDYRKKVLETFLI